MREELVDVRMIRNRNGTSFASGRGRDGCRQVLEPT